jgi:endonuclease YncB( thermonuclease family)
VPNTDHQTKTFSKMAMRGLVAGAALFWAVTGSVANDSKVPSAAGEDMVALAPAGTATPSAPTTAASGGTLTVRAHRFPIRYNKLVISAQPQGSDDVVQLELAGLDGISFNQVCRSADGARIACGSRARMKLIHFISGKTMACRVSNDTGQVVKVDTCTLDGQDLGEWIVRAGIGRPTRSGLHVAALREARAAQRGMWVDAEARNGIVLASN